MQWLLCVLSCVFPTQAASQPQKGNAELARAVVLEQSEQDLKGAAAVYRSVAGDAAVEPSLRARASLLLGKLLRQLGEKADAEAAFTAAAAGQGPAAEEAKKILAGQEPDQAVLKARVDKAMAELRTAPDSGVQAFGFIGRDAVPMLAAALEQEKVDRGFLIMGVRVLTDLGGAEAAACIGRLWNSADTFVRNAAREALGSGRVRDPDVEKFFRDQLKAPDADGRAAALWAIGHRLSVDEILPWLAEPRARGNALWFLSNRALLPADVDRMAPALASLLSASEPGESEFFWRLLNKQELTATSSGRSLQLKALFWSGRRGRRLQYSWPTGLGHAEHAEELVAAAQRAGEVPADRSHVELNDQLRSMVSNMLQFWRSPATPQVLALAQLGYDRDLSLSQWIAHNLADEHVPAILDAMPRLNQDSLLIADELLKRPLPTSAYGPLFAWIEKLREPDQKLERWLRLAVRVDTKEAQEYLVKRAGLRAGAYEIVGRAFLAEFDSGEQRPSARQEAAMVALMRMKAEGPNVIVVRSVLFKTLARLGSQGAAEALPEAYRHGLMYVNWPGLDNNAQLRGVQVFASKVWLANGSGTKEMPAQGYDTETVARTVGRCLEAGLTFPFDDVTSALWRVPDAYPPPVMAAICARATACVESKDSPGLRGRLLSSLLQSRVSAPDRAPYDKMILACLQHPDTAFPLAMLRGLAGDDGRGNYARAAQAPAAEAVAEIPRLLLHQEPEVVRAAAILLGQLQRKELADHLIPVLRHSVNLVRLEAVNQLGALAPERILDQAAVLLRDPDPQVRLAVVALCERKLDRRAVPGLLELLKDPAVSAAAAKALKTIEFYVDQTERWQRLLQNSGLQANSAAEALLKQAGKDQKKDVRLLAIASLGTLGVPETQPFLIECARESDPELAAAARAALEKIHRAAR